MPGRLRIKRRSVFYSWLVSYLSILLIPLAISLLIAVRTGSVLESQIRRANGSVLMQVHDIMDNHLRNIESLTTEIALDPQVQGLAYTEPPLTNEQRFNAHKVSQELKVFRAANSSIDALYIYFKHTDFVVSDSSMADGSNYYAAAGLGPVPSSQEWKGIVGGVHAREFMALGAAPGLNEPRIAFLQSVPVLSPASSDANIVVMLSPDLFQQSVRSIGWLKEGLAFIIDRNGTIVSSSASEVPPSLRTLALPGSSGVVVSDLNGQKCVVAYLASDVNDWKYVSVIPSSIFWEASHDARRFALVSIVLCFLLGSLVAYFFLRRNYRPVDSLIRAIAQRADLAPGGERNEYELIGDALTKTISEKDSFHARLELQKGALRESLLQGLLRGQVPGGIALEDRLSQLDIRLDTDLFIVLLFYVNAPTDGAREQEGTPPDLETLRYVMARAAEELAAGCGQGFSCRMDNLTACVVNLRDTTGEAAPETLKGAAEKVRELAADRFGLRVTASISAVHRTTRGVAEAYGEAVQALEYAVAVGLEGAVRYGEIAPPAKSQYDYSLEEEQQLINSIRTGDAGKAKALLANVLERNRGGRGGEPGGGLGGAPLGGTMKHVYYDLAGTLLKAASAISEPAGSEAARVIGLLESSIETGNPAAIEQAFAGTTEGVCRLVEEERKRRDPRREFVERVERHIAQHYADVNLCISSIADAFGITPDYLSRLFRDRTGDGILDRINRVRLEIAKRLLVEGTRSIKDIAGAAGYSNTTTFTRIFRRHEGVTPGEYKTVALRARDRAGEANLRHPS